MGQYYLNTYGEGCWRVVCHILRTERPVPQQSLHPSQEPLIDEPDADEHDSQNDEGEHSQESLQVRQIDDEDLEDDCEDDDARQQAPIAGIRQKAGNQGDDTDDKPSD